MEKDLTPEQSLATIQAMISEAKNSFHRMSFYFLLWGILLMAATLIEYFVAGQGLPNGWLAWPILGTLGGVVAGVRGAQEGRKRGVSTNMDRVFMWLWGAFTITLIILIIAFVSQDQRPGPYISILTGMPTFITGAVMRFRPLQIGGILFWVLGLLALFVWPEQGALLFALALLGGYIVPGIMLKHQEDGLRSA